MTTTTAYTATFDNASLFFSTVPGTNAVTLDMKQRWANDKLRKNGHLFLNEVLDMLGLPRVRRGQIDGWVTGDNVDFGVYSNELNAHFFNESSKAAHLTFNCQDNILDLVFGSET